MKRLLVTLGLLMLTAPLWAQGNATITCTAPTQNTDGTLLTNLTGFKFYHGVGVAQPTTWPDVRTVTGAVCAYVWTGLPAGTHWFTATATTPTAESAFSNVASKVIAVTPVVPGPPSGLSVTIEQIAYVLIQSRDRVALVPVGTIPQGTQCDASQPIMGRYVVPRAAVVWAGTVRSEVVVASCG
jgi:hypothetical protein